MEIKRDIYLNRLIDRRENGSVKVITGIRRCGKSYLLFNLFYRYLIEEGVPKDHIIRIALDDEEHEELLDSKVLGAYIRDQILDDEQYYVFLDEIQYADGFEKVLNGLNRRANLDIYVTGSNSKFLSTDILTEFRGRGDEVRVYPLCFSEYVSVYNGSVQEAWADYFTYGGLPMILTRKTDEQKSKYLSDLFKKVYIDDIVERNSLRGDRLWNIWRKHQKESGPTKNMKWTSCVTGAVSATIYSQHFLYRIRRRCVRNNNLWSIQVIFLKKLLLSEMPLNRGIVKMAY